MSVRFKYYLRGCGLGILVASLVFIVSLHAHGGAMSDEKAMQRASELGMIMPDDTQTQEAETQTTELPVKETNLPDTQRTTQAVTQKVPQNDTQKQTERDTSSEQNDTSKESEKKAEEKKKTQDSQKKEEEKEKAQETEKEETKKEKVSITIKGGEVCREIAQDLQDKIDSLNYEKKQYSQDEIENYESIVAWTIYFAAFFDGKMEYEYSTGKIRAVINLLKRYASYDLTKKYLKNPLRYTKKIPALSYKIMLGGFAFLMKCNMYLLLSLGIKLLVDCHIDERLSDTGRKED